MSSRRDPWSGCINRLDISSDTATPGKDKPCPASLHPRFSYLIQLPDSAVTTTFAALTCLKFLFGNLAVIIAVKIGETFRLTLKRTVGLCRNIVSEDSDR